MNTSSYSSSDEEKSDINEAASAMSVAQSSVLSLASEPFWLGGIGEYEEEVDSATVSAL